MDLKLEVVVIPVSDVDRAKEFYVSAGFRLDADFPISEDFRIVQVTPPGSEASVIFGVGLTPAPAGQAGPLYLVVSDVVAARDELVAKGVDVSEVFHGGGGPYNDVGRQAGPHPEGADYASFATFVDPDGNTWVLQEVKTRAPGR